MDVFESAGHRLAILWISATAHMPDVMEMPYRPDVFLVETGEAGDRNPEEKSCGHFRGRILSPCGRSCAPPISDPSPQSLFTYRLGGPTCLAGDVVGDFSFPRELKVGDTLVFDDMAHYTMVKTTMFNGVKHPAIALQHDDGKMEVIREVPIRGFPRPSGVTSSSARDFRTATSLEAGESPSLVASCGPVSRSIRRRDEAEIQHNPARRHRAGGDGRPGGPARFQQKSRASRSSPTRVFTPRPTTRTVREQASRAKVGKPARELSNDDLLTIYNREGPAAALAAAKSQPWPNRDDAVFFILTHLAVVNPGVCGGRTANVRT